MITVPFILGLLITSIVITGKSIFKAKKNQFYSDTYYLWPFGIYVWGDGIVLGPFWFLVSLLALFLESTQQQLLQGLVLFWIIRSAYEVVYWLVHQANFKEYEPPLFRNISWLGGQEAAILYQLLHTCIVVLGLVLLFFF